MRSLRLVVGNVLVLLGLLVTCALVAEGVLRVTPRPNQSESGEDGTKYRFSIYQPDGVLDYVHRPDWEAVQQHAEFEVTARTNAFGLRGGPIETPKPPGVYRVLVLGDSFAFGWGVEDDEAFPARLATRLAPPPGRDRVEVLNAGVAGWSAVHYLLFLRHQGLALEPDLVLLAPSENDLSDLAALRVDFDADLLPVRAASTLRMIDATGRMRYIDEGHLALPRPSFPGQTWLADHTLVYHWLRYRLAKLWVGYFQDRALAKLAKEAGSPPEGAIEDLSPEEVARGLWTGHDFQLRYHRYLVRAIEADCAARGVAVRRILVTRKGEPEARDDASRALRDDCRADPHCVLSQDLLGSLPDEEAFFELDGHWRPAGHAAVAAALAPWLAPLPTGAAPGSLPRNAAR